MLDNWAISLIYLKHVLLFNCTIEITLLATYLLTCVCIGFGVG